MLQNAVVHCRITVYKEFCTRSHSASSGIYVSGTHDGTARMITVISKVIIRELLYDPVFVIGMGPDQTVILQLYPYPLAGKGKIGVAEPVQK